VPRSAGPRINQVYADKRNPGRWVKVIAYAGMSQIQVETVKAADNAQTARAVGRQTWIDEFNFGHNFTLVDHDELARELPAETQS
jgi:hypothetical protein